MVRDLWRSAWPSSAGGSKSGLSQQPKNSAIITIGGTNRKATSSNNPLNSKSSQWNRLGESDEEPSQSRDDLELVPKHMAGRVQVTVHADPTRQRRSDEGRSARGSKSTASEDDFPMDVIRQRTDVEWRVEERR